MIRLEGINLFEAPPTTPIAELNYAALQINNYMPSQIFREPALQKPTKLSQGTIYLLWMQPRNAAWPTFPRLYLRVVVLSLGLSCLGRRFEGASAFTLLYMKAHLLSLSDCLDQNLSADCSSKVNFWKHSSLHVWAHETEKIIQYLENILLTIDHQYWLTSA